MLHATSYCQTAHLLPSLSLTRINQHVIVSLLGAGIDVWDVAVYCNIKDWSRALVAPKEETPEDEEILLYAEMLCTLAPSFKTTG